MLLRASPETTWFDKKKNPDKVRQEPRQALRKNPDRSENNPEEVLQVPRQIQKEPGLIRKQCG